MKVGLIGAGLQGQRRARVLRQVDGARLAFVADVNEQAAEALAREAGCRSSARWQDVIEDRVDAVLVCTPPHLHAPIGIAAAEAGKHVLCEKPLARTLAEAEAMVGATKAAGVKLKCGLNHRHHPGIRQAHRWLSQGRIGEIDFIRCRYGIGGRVGYEREWRGRADIAGGGQLMDQGTHAVDLSRWFLGEFSEVFAFLSTRFWAISPLEDNAFALLRTASGQVASLHASWTQWKNLFSFEVYGHDGYIQVEGLGGSYGIERAILGLRDFSAPFREEISEFRGEDTSWHEEWREFVAAIGEKRDPLGSGQDGLAALRLVDALYESARTGRVVRLEEG
jgi:predicted dehydrogenase